MSSSAVDKDCSLDTRLTGENLKVAIELNDDREDKSRLLQVLIYTDPYESDEIAPIGKHCFFSHRGPDTKKQLVEPLQRTLKALYEIDCFVDSLPLSYYSNDNKVDVLRRALWSCRNMVIFLSAKFHKSKWALKELYTAIYRATVDSAFVYTIVYCVGMDPRQCQALEAYQRLDLGRSWGTLHTWNLSFSDLVVRHVHEVVVRLVLGDAVTLKDDDLIMSKFEKECKVREPVFQQGVPAPLPSFEGREEEIQEISTMLHTQRAAVIFPIGVGGAGKSQLVVEWVDQNRLNYEIIVWIRAEHRDTLCQDLARLAEVLGIRIGPDDFDDSAAKLVVDNLSYRSASRPYVLLVYDNAESYNDISAWLPRPGSPCHLIVTTRNGQGCSPCSTVAVGPLDKDSALRVIEYLIKRRLAPQEVSEVTDMLKGFGYLPLAIVLFAQLIRVKGVEDAVTMVKSQTQDVLHNDIALGHVYGGEGRQSVWSVCRIQIDGMSASAKRLLFCLSFLDADNVPTPVLNHCIANHLQLEELTSRSLVKVNSEDGSVSTHRLIQSAARILIGTAAARMEVMDSIGAALLHSVEDIDFRLGRRNKIVTDILPHLKTLNNQWMGHGESSGTLGKLKHLVGTIYYHDAKYDLSLGEYRESLRIKRAAYGNEHREVAFTLNGLGNVYRQQGHYELALVEYVESLRIKRAVFGNEHHEVADTIRNMGRVYYRQGHFERALVQYNESLRIDRAAFGNEHPSVATTLRNMGNVYYQQCQYERALVEYDESLRIERAALGNEHPNVARLLHNMGRVYYQQSQYERAFDEYCESLRISRAVLGNEHPSVALTLNDMGNVYERQGQYERAMVEYHESLRIMRATYGHEHHSVADALNNMGHVYQQQGHYELALDKYRESLRIKRITYGDEHREVAITLCSMGNVYEWRGQYRRSMVEYRESLRIHRLIFEAGHPDLERIVGLIAAAASKRRTEAAGRRRVWFPSATEGRTETNGRRRRLWFHFLPLAVSFPRDRGVD